MSSIELTSEGYSFHTMEFKVHPDSEQYHTVLSALYSAAEKSKKCTYPLPKSHEQAHCSTVLSPQGIRLYLTKTETHGYTIKAIVNPRRVLEPNCGYLGIMPTDSGSFEDFQDQFALLMRKYHLPNFLDDWSLTRLDPCVNLMFTHKKSAREICRLLQKDLLPSKMERVFFLDHTSRPEEQREQKEKDKHSICLRNKSYSLVVYDKLYQIEEEGLSKGSRRSLPDGILRMELRCMKPYINKLADPNSFSTSEQIRYLTEQSRELILERARKAFSGGTHYKPDAMKALISDSQFQSHTREQLLWMADRMRYPFDIRKLEKGMKRTFDVKPRTVAKRLEQLQELGINPIPLRKDFYLSQLPSFPQILELLEDDSTTLTLDSDGRILY